jgi:hypothetical protein
LARSDSIIELEKARRLNLISNLKYISDYVDRISKMSNRRWSEKQKLFIDEIQRTRPKEITVEGKTISMLEWYRSYLKSKANVR